MASVAGGPTAVEPKGPAPSTVQASNMNGTSNGSSAPLPPPPSVHHHQFPRSRMSGAAASMQAITTPAPPQPQHQIPLSARRSGGLDLASVERRGQDLPPKTSRPHGLKEALTYYPTAEEFRAGPLEYIRKIEPEASKYGICKIVPPADWKPPFAIDTERFHFRTRKQELNLADGGTRANLNYLDQLAMFHKQRSGTALNRFPSVDKRPLDLYKLKKYVEDKGGFDRVCKDKRWAEIGRDLGYSGKIMSSLSTSLKNSYQKWLQPYEDWLLQNRPQVLQQQERANGGPYTPSPSGTPAKSQKNSPLPPAAAQPAIQATQTLVTALNNPEQLAIPPPLPPPPQQSGFVAVNSGFTAVNAASGFIAVNLATTAPIESFAPPSIASTFDSVSAPNGLKRQHSEDDVNDDDASGRRSKRSKKDNAPTVTGSQMIQPRIAAPKISHRDRSNDKPGDCDVCGRGSEAGATINCDTCDITYHKNCLDGPLRSGADSDWHCPRCLVGTGEFGFEEGNIYSLRQFQQKANQFKERHFERQRQFEADKSKRPVTEEDVEREFWRLTESLTDTVEVEYGADVHSTTHGSGFDTIERQPFSHYATDPWNLNVMPLDKDSLFRYIKTDISGMTVPWLYVGMCFSTFCWHNEDHYTYSANYQHFGETKTWYGIPSICADRFEAAMKETVPELFEQQPDLLFQLVTLLQPEKLRNADVSVYALDQRAGEFIITFPQAYHAGFNHGFNFNEAVNFAPPDWEPFGAMSIHRLQDFRRQPVFSHDELLFSAASRDHTIKTAKWLAPALERVREKEFNARDAFKVEYQRAVANITVRDEDKPEEIAVPEFILDSKAVPDEETVCVFCKAYGFLSRFVCRNTGRVLCLLHAPTFECCSGHIDQRLIMKDGKHELHYRMTDDEISTLLQKVLDTSQTPDVWEAKLNTVLDGETKPDLKKLRTLVTEGEKIDASWPLEGLTDLKSFVRECNAWVEDALIYITRKQNRRKSEFRSSRNASDDPKKQKTAEKEKDDGKKDALRNPEKIEELLKAAADLSFECPELEKLQERHERIADFRRRAKDALKKPLMPEDELHELIEEGKDLDIDISEMQSLDKQSRMVRWFAQAKGHTERMEQGIPLTLNDVNAFIAVGTELSIPNDNDYMIYFLGQKEQGEFWETKAHQVMNVENVNFQQLDALFSQASRLPVSKETLNAIDEMLKKQREAQEKILMLYERTKELDPRNRPKYRDVRDTMESLADLNSKPPGTLDLEKEQKRHEDWMRRGKKLFGKANAPLRILLEYMQFVAERNDNCFDVRDSPRMPVEPASREVSPDDENQPADGGGPNSENIFCICRKAESGMMIECELCHEWYHGRCLKIARGKVKEDDKYTCPICDYRVKIPRDANRPKLEELQNWQDEIPQLPFQPEEEDCLAHIIDSAQDFRVHISTIINTVMSTPDDLPVQRFYLRKIEGAEVLLVEETNFLRGQVHKWAPVAPEPPKMIEVSLSTRKPRPTKAQKLVARMGLASVDQLPEHLRPKPPRRKPTNDYISGKGSKPANPSSAAKPGESIKSISSPRTKEERRSSLSSRSPPLRGPGSIHVPPQHHHHMHAHMGPSRSPASYGGYGAMPPSPLGLHGGPSPYSVPSTPLFATPQGHGRHTSQSGPVGMSGHGGYARAPHSHAGADAVDPALEDLFGPPPPSTSPRESHINSMRAGGIPHHGGVAPGEDLFHSLTNGADDEDPGFFGAGAEDPSPYGPGMVSGAGFEGDLDVGGSEIDAVSDVGIPDDVVNYEVPGDAALGAEDDGGGVIASVQDALYGASDVLRSPE